VIRILIFLFVGIIVFFSCSSQREEEQIQESVIEYPDQESWQATIRITKDGQTVGLLQAGHIQKFNQKKITLLKDGLVVDFFNTQGEHTSVLNSGGGTVYDDRQDMIAYENVVVVSDSGLQLFSDTLRWDNKNQKIYSDIPVRIVSDEADTLYGDRFTSDTDLSNYEIVNPRGKSTKSLRID